MNTDIDMHYILDAIAVGEVSPEHVVKAREQVRSICAALTASQPVSDQIGRQALTILNDVIEHKDGWLHGWTESEAVLRDRARAFIAENLPPQIKEPK